MIKYKNYPNEEKPRERFKKYGVENISNEELLEIILKTGTKKKNVKELSYEIISIIGTIINLKNETINSLMEIEGIGEVKAIELLAAVELGKRIYNNVNIDKFQVNNPHDLIKYYQHLFKDKMQEEFHVIFLDNKSKIISHKLLFKGTVNMSISHPREIFKEAYLNSAVKIICLHNHPSGDVLPSKNDIDLTRKLQEISLIHDIKLLDHIIIGNNNYYSFLENKYIINNQFK